MQKTATHLLGCPLATEVQTAWLEHFVVEREPFFLPDDLLPLLPADIPLLARADTTALLLSRSALDTYGTFRIGPQARWLTALTPAVFADLTREVQERLLAAQWSLGRRHVYPWDTIQPLLPDTLPPALVQRRTAAAPHVLGLDSALWHALDHSQRWHWIEWFVLQQASPYPVVPLEAVQGSPPAVVELANTFCAHSGPNCFATTLAAITPDRASARLISELWLTADAFLHGLAQRGYRDQQTHAVEPTGLADAVVVWADAEDVPRHACYVIAAGIALNKDAQTWYAPRQLVGLAAIIDVWAEDGYRLKIYQRR